MGLRYNKQMDRWELKTSRKLLFFSCDWWGDVYYVIPTIRIDLHREYGEKCFWFFFLGMYFLIDIFKIKD